MIKVKIVEDEQGQYQNEQGKRFNLIACSWVKGQRANEFKEFISLQDALKYYKLIDPNAPVGKREEEQPEEIKSFESSNEDEENVNDENINN